ncbi:xyloside xylosyltransferase 1-like [Polyodon spathula]|uniref:xyloside xylosyltransferase 1-like n=1 Tax=Polyodon spathula TaxID=7913 RepID=UPI001B7D9210|nr:xyloside xylosyltransferase 1-like [Polyodon spathula]
MGIIRLLSNAMARVGTVRYYQLVLVIAAALAVVAFYSFGSDRHNFSSTTKRIKETHASHNANSNNGDLSPDTNGEQRVSKAVSVGEAGRTNTDSVNAAAKTRTPEEGPRYFHALMMFTKVDTSQQLQQKFQVAMRSMLKHARFEDGEVLTLHFVSDEPSREIGEKILGDFLQGATFRCELQNIGSERKNYRNGFLKKTKQGNVSVVCCEFTLFMPVLKFFTCISFSVFLV